jgi:hypothetical protein
MSKWKRVLITMGVVVIVGAIYLWLFGVQTVSALIVRYSYGKMPDVAKTPVPLSDSSISKVSHRQVSYFGYEFELPWDDVDEQKDKTFGTIHVSYSRSGNAFWFSTFPSKELVNDIIKMGKLDPQGFRQLYGDEAFESDFAFHQKMFQVTPSKITPFISRRQAVAGSMLLIIKATSMPNAASGYSRFKRQGSKDFNSKTPKPARPESPISYIPMMEASTLSFFKRPMEVLPHFLKRKLTASSSPFARPRYRLSL